MKKIYTITAMLLCLVMFTACGRRRSIDCSELAERINTEVEFDEPLTELDAVGAERYFNINPSIYDEVAAYVGTKGVCDEFVIIKTDSPSSVSSKLRDHIEKLKKEYAQYRPNELSKLDNAIIESHSGSVVMIISPDAGQAKKVYDNYMKK